MQSEVALHVPASLSMLQDVPTCRSARGKGRYAAVSIAAEMERKQKKRMLAKGFSVRFEMQPDTLFTEAKEKEKDTIVMADKSASSL